MLKPLSTTERLLLPRALEDKALTSSHFLQKSHFTLSLSHEDFLFSLPSISQCYFTTL